MHKRTPKWLKLELTPGNHSYFICISLCTNTGHLFLSKFKLILISPLAFIFHYHWWTASIKPRLLFSHSGIVSWGLPFLQFATLLQYSTLQWWSNLHIFNPFVGPSEIMFGSTQCGKLPNTMRHIIKANQKTEYFVYYSKFAKDHYFYSALQLCICNRYENWF